MKPSSLLGITLELLEALAIPGPQPADATVARFFRTRRFLGSHDRRFIGGVVYAWLRHFPRASVRWSAWSGGIAASGSRDTEGLLRDLVALARDGLLPWRLAELASAAGDIATGPAPSAIRRPAADPLLESILERPDSAAARLAEDAWPDDPQLRLAGEMALPGWLATRLVAERGAEGARALASRLLEGATLDLRVNRARCSVEEARRSLEDSTRLEVTRTPWSPLGLRIARRENLAATEAVRRGWVEVEDEGSQIVALATDPPASGVLVDACAGAGGKVLALADIVRVQERAGAKFLACDVSGRRLEELERRAARGGIRDLIRIVTIPRSGDLPAAIPEADLVLLDAPCSGLGTLRRNPDLKLRHGPADLERFRRLQVEILDRWAPRVRRGGRLAYATCSILSEENEEVARTFEASHPGFEPCPSAWAEAHLPESCLQGASIHLDPVLTGTDGFFMTIWKRM